MKLASVPWAEAVSPTPSDFAPLRPIGIIDGAKNKIQLSGFRDSPKTVCGSTSSFELPRPLTHKHRGLATVSFERVQIPLTIAPSVVFTNTETLDVHAGMKLASQIATVASWLEPSTTTVSLSQLRQKLLEAISTDEPPMALIVEIAKRHRSHLELICQDPRVQLRRRRELQLVDRVRQLDSASLRWLARQPGQTIAEKAGPRERILGVRRYRSSDTLENRILIDTLRRSVEAAQTYKGLYRSHVRADRVKLVAEVERSFRSVLRDEWITDIAPLNAVPVPNYVLLSDRRYAPVWKLWQRLVKQEQLFQSLEAWLPRVVAELAWIGLLASINDDASPLRVLGGSMPKLLYKPEFEAGEFLIGNQPMPPLAVRGSSSDVRIDLVRGDQMISLSRQKSSNHFLYNLATLRPDFALVSRADDGISGIVPVWSLATWNEQDDDQISEAIRLLEIRLQDWKAMAQAAWLQPILIIFRAAKHSKKIQVNTTNIRIFDISDAEKLLTSIPLELVNVLAREISHA